MVFSNQEGRFLISFSNFGGRTFSHLLILTLRIRGVGLIPFPGHFRTLRPFSVSGKAVVGLFLRRRSLYPTELRVHALIYKEFSDFFESFTEPILLTSANTFPSTHGYRRFFGPGPMLANLPEKINFRTDSCSGQESISLCRLPSAVLLGGDRSILLSYGTILSKDLILLGFREFDVFSP
jgi:hypothetical protein